MDATPNYMAYPERIRELYEAHGTADQVKILFTLRAPVSREISWFEHLVRENQNDRPTPEWAKQVLREDGSLRNFEEHMERNIIPDLESGDAENLGVYVKWLSRWFELFDRRQILVASYHDLAANQTDFLQRLHAFLELPVDNPQPLTLPLANSMHAVNVTQPPTCEGRSKLSGIFSAYNEELYDLLDRHPGPEMEVRPFTRFVDEACGG